MMRKVRNFLALAAIFLAAGLGACRSANAGVTLDFNISPVGGNDLVLTGLPTSGTATYYLGVSGSNTVQITNQGQINQGNYFYSVQITTTDNSATATNQAQLIDAAVTVSTGNQSSNTDVLTVTMSDTNFTAPTGSNLTLLSSLKITSINEGSSSTHDGPGGSSDPDTVSGYGKYLNPGTTSDGAQDNAGGSTTGFNASGTYADSGVNITNPTSNSSYTLVNSMTFSLGTDNDTATVQNTVTVTAPAAAPEPSTTILAASALGTLGLVGLRRRLRKPVVTA
jgi:hypothetical protein